MGQSRRQRLFLPIPSRIGSSVHPVALYTALTVDPDHRRLALPMVEHLRRHSEERGIAFAIGMVPNDPTSISYRFWTKYAQTFPQKFRFLFRGSYWAKFLAPRELTRASLETWQRLAGRTLGPLLRLIRMVAIPACGPIAQRTLSAARSSWTRPRRGSIGR